MKAMILAGGLSTRLYPLTRTVPKPLVPVAGTPNAVHLMRYLKSFGFDEVVINVHYLPDAILKTLGDGSQFGVRLTYSHEAELLGSAGGLKKVQSFFDTDEPFVVIGCDEVTDIPLDRVIAFHRENRAIASIGLVECANVEQYGVVVLDDRAKIVGFQEKPKKGSERSKLANTGLYVFSPKIFDRIPSNSFYDFGKQVFPELQEAGAPFYGYWAKAAYWSDIGTPDEYRRASFDLLTGVVRIPDTSPMGIDASSQIAAGVRIEGPVHIGAGARIGANVAIVGPTIVGDGVAVDDDVYLERAIVWEGARIGTSAVVRGTVVGAAYQVAPGAALDRTLVALE